ncbi:helix-turn-helix domain-containing protein [Herbiconiux moechotypicola]|uniref:IclR family transcriptional regulator n=1 Tax=Herbiconiux moechotypicola TaxID=637393 RepID=A0ABP5QSC1_9MICO|nr:helix-turn-helix domain-containing protein [Herbiconiux moechotypicola]MCS5730958.1 helix-turn-helix domain-containing protein [Herbiconiux moechotypicola]
MPPDYAVPALDKALDILEVLAALEGGLTQLEIAVAVERTPSQIFRVLTTLERRGYVHRDRQSGVYSLSLRLFELANRTEPVRTLVEAAAEPMRRLAEAAGQSCNLSVRDIDRVRVIAQVESPADFGFRVRVGAEFSLDDTATGAVLRAFDGGEGASELEARLIRELGYLERPDVRQPSITDLVFPVLGREGPDGPALAALTVPYVATSYSSVSSGTVIDAGREAVTLIGANLGY